MKLVALAAALLVSTAATAAAPRHVTIPLGETRALTLPEEVSKVELTREGVIEVKRNPGGTLTLQPIATGKTRLHLRTESNAEVELLVFVTSAGGVEFIQTP